MNVLTTLLCCLSLLNGPSTVPGASWRWPLAPVPAVLRGFSPPAVPWGPGHRGVDLAARPGQPVYAAGAGLVSYAARLSGRGVIAILHGPALRTTYLPVRPSVRPGRRVAAGDRIGVVEDLPGHCGPRVCLHWGLLRGPVYLDPLSLVRPVQVRLLPVWGVPPAGHASRPPGPHPAVPYGSGARERPPSAGSARPGRHRPGGAAAGPALSLAGSAGGIREAGGGLVAGMLVAFTLMLAWRRLPLRRRPPGGVIDLARERRRRRCARSG
ncbi:murein hydrolase activator EnvC family protein [Actinomadura scrupuli]|uniref:murein hydrolase activator EnvC family protein n=1 Tax=Actinomadura scrupuli TaxID=559629 RepID=UPI003D952AF3